MSKMSENNKDKKYRKRNKMYRSMSKDMARLFADNTIPQHLQEEYMDGLTPDEQELFKSDIKKQRNKLDKLRKKKKKL